VGLSQVCGLGAPLQAGEPLAVVHAANEAAADAAVRAVLAAVTLCEPAALSAIGRPVVEGLDAA
jgi:thymidine phosphorylase